MAIELIANLDIDHREMDIDAKETDINEICDVDKATGTVELLAEGGEGGRKKKDSCANFRRHIHSLNIPARTSQVWCLSCSALSSFSPLS